MKNKTSYLFLAVIVLSSQYDCSRNSKMRHLVSKPKLNFINNVVKIRDTTTCNYGTVFNGKDCIGKISPFKSKIQLYLKMF